MRQEWRERFPRHRLQGKPLVSDPSMHLGTCLTHVPWCMSGSLTRDGGKNVPGIPGACATRNFTYLARSPCLEQWWRSPVRHQATNNNIDGYVKPAGHCFHGKPDQQLICYWPNYHEYSGFSNSRVEGTSEITANLGNTTLIGLLNSCSNCPLVQALGRAFVIFRQIAMKIYKYILDLLLVNVIRVLFNIYIYICVCVCCP